MNAPSFVYSIVFVVGLVLIFIGERLIGSGTARTAVSFLGVAGVVVAAAVRAARAARAAGDEAVARTQSRWLATHRGRIFAESTTVDVLRFFNAAVSAEALRVSSEKEPDAR